MEQTTANAAATDEETIWKARVLDAQRFDGTLVEYCKQHGFNRRVFQGYREKFGVAKRYQRRRPKGFVKVECPEVVQKAPSISPLPERRHGLPDPVWLADFIHALQRSR